MTKDEKISLLKQERANLAHEMLKLIDSKSEDFEPKRGIMHRVKEIDANVQQLLNAK